MKTFNYILTATMTIFFASCSTDDSSPTEGSGNGLWSIPEDEVFAGGPGKDGIPALTEPLFIPAAEADYLDEDDLVLGYRDGSDIRAYPHAILDWHEIVNDKVNGLAFAVNYCPLTGTGISWGRTFDGVETTFGVSGLLYNSNLILFDRETDSYWSQMLLQSVKGDLRGTWAETFHIVETTWATWQEMYPETKVISTETGYNRSYGFYPYRDYREDHDHFLFPFSPVDNRLNSKERVHGIIIQDSAKAYRLNTFAGGLTIVEDTFMSEPIVITGSKENDFIVSFSRTMPDGTILSFEPSPANSAADEIMTDLEGNTWDVFGEALSGPRQGERLSPTRSFMGFWFAWGAFYPELLIYGE